MTGLPMPLLLRGDTRRLPLPDESVDLIVASPPYFGLRSYTDNGAHYEGQIGSETTPTEFRTSRPSVHVRPTGGTGMTRYQLLAAHDTLFYTDR